MLVNTDVTYITIGEWQRWRFSLSGFGDPTANYSVVIAPQALVAGCWTDVDCKPYYRSFKRAKFCIVHYRNFCKKFARDLEYRCRLRGIDGSETDGNGEAEYTHDVSGNKRALKLERL